MSTLLPYPYFILITYASPVDVTVFVSNYPTCLATPLTRSFPNSCLVSSPHEHAACPLAISYVLSAPGQVFPYLALPRPSLSSHLCLCSLLCLDFFPRPSLVLVFVIILPLRCQGLGVKLGPCIGLAVLSLLPCWMLRTLPGPCDIPVTLLSWNSTMLRTCITCHGFCSEYLVTLLISI